MCTLVLNTCMHVQVDVLFDKSSLSPYIRFGCLSVRHFLYHVKQLASKDSSAEALLKDVTGKLLQREFYFTVAKQVSKIGRAEQSREREREREAHLAVYYIPTLDVCW